LSLLRARCPDCRTVTAVAVGGEYECHACGRVFGSGLVRVPRAWGAGGEAMADAAELPLPYPEVAVVAEDTLAAQTLALAADLPERPLILGGCCCSHVGAVEGLASRYGKLAVVWLDAHGDLNTRETSPSGNEWGMPLRMLLDSGAAAPERTALVGVRSLDPPERSFLAGSGLHSGSDAVERATAETDCVYVALDLDVLDPAEIAAFMPEPGGLSVDEVEQLLVGLASRKTIVGAGLTGLTAASSNLPVLSRFCTALGL